MKKTQSPKGRQEEPTSPKGKPPRSPGAQQPQHKTILKQAGRPNYFGGKLTERILDLVHRGVANKKGTAPNINPTTKKKA